MKKTLVIIALVLILSTSVIAGTLAMYTTTVDVASGSVVAKEFVLIENGEDTFETDVKIAPGETVEWQFSVKNYNGAIISETAMDLDFVVNVAAADEKSMIAPLEVTVTDEGSNVVGSCTNSGTITFSSTFALNSVGQEKTYTVSVTWPSDDAEDIKYAGSNFGAAVTVSVTGTQQ